MKEPAVVDSTCLIGLEQIGRLEILPHFFEPVVAPPEVEHEAGIVAPWLRIEAPDPTLVTALQLMVDDGEAEVIALAAERRWKAVLDDLRARDLAKRMGLDITGTVGLLVRAKRQGLIPWLNPILSELTEKGFYLSEDLKREALRLAGE